MITVFCGGTPGFLNNCTLDYIVLHGVSFICFSCSYALIAQSFISLFFGFPMVKYRPKSSQRVRSLDANEQVSRIC